MRKFLFTLLAAIIYASTPNLAEHSLEVYGNASLGYYYVKIFVGNPPQEQTVIIDTGSGQLALPCNKCKKCSQHHINTPFDMGKSKTAEYVTCVNLYLTTSKVMTRNVKDARIESQPSRARFPSPMLKAAPWKAS